MLLSSLSLHVLEDRVAQQGTEDEQLLVVLVHVAMQVLTFWTWDVKFSWLDYLTLKRRNLSLVS